MDNQTQVNENTVKQVLVKTAAYLANNWLRIILLLAILSVTLFGLGVKAARYVEKPEFCNSCHSMKPYHSSWADSSHKDISCFSCHFGYTPAAKVKPMPITQKKIWIIELKDRIIDISKQMNYFKNQVVGISVRVYNFRVWFSEVWSKMLDLRKIYIMAIGGSTSGDAEGFWNNCIRCHQDLFESDSKTDNFGHEKHLKKGIACNECHRNTVHGRRVQTRREDCLACHDNLPRPSSHNTGLFNFSHGQMYIKSGGCEVCHLKGIKEPLCSNCHGIEMPHPAEYTMYHIQDIHKVNIKTCLNCHKDEEQLNGGVTPKAMSCNRCHGPNLPHKGYQSILKSHGSQAITDGTKGCLSCHISKQCTDCHGMPIPHAPGFLKQHRNEAKRYPIEKCMNCHDSYGGKAKSCIGCHVVEMPHPPDWNSTHGPKKDQNCNYCHSPKNPASPGAPWARANFCQKCHGKKKHFEDHAHQPGLKLKDCYECHGEAGCTKCHLMNQ